MCLHNKKNENNDDDVAPKSRERGYFKWDEDDDTCLQAAATFYAENGYVVITGHQSRSSLTSIQQCAESIMTEFLNDEKQTSSASVFTTRDQARKKKDDQFLSSASEVRCFLEEEREEKQVNKIGHALHDLTPEFIEFSRSERVKKIVMCVLQLSSVQHAVPVQSMYIVKSARHGGAVLPHRDCTFITPESGRPGDCVGLWWAVQQATLQNGCLWIIPKSHVVQRKHLSRFIRTENDEMIFKPYDDINKDGDVNEYSDDDYIAVPADAGDLVVLHGAVLHKSEHNESSYSRHAYSVHVVKDGLKRDCWLQRNAQLPFRPF